MSAEEYSGYVSLLMDDYQKLIVSLFEFSQCFNSDSGQAKSSLQNEKGQQVIRDKCSRVFRSLIAIKRRASERVSKLKALPDQKTGYESFKENDGSIVPVEIIDLINECFYDMKYDNKAVRPDCKEEEFKVSYKDLVERARKCTEMEIARLKHYRLQFAARRAMIEHFLANFKLGIHSDDGDDTFSDCFIPLSSMLYNGADCASGRGTFWRGRNMLIPEVIQYMTVEMSCMDISSRNKLGRPFVRILNVYWLQNVLTNYVQRCILKDSPLTEQETNNIAEDSFYSLFMESPQRKEQFNNGIGIIKYAFMNQCGMSFNYSGSLEIENMKLIATNHKHCNKKGLEVINRWHVDEILREPEKPWTQPKVKYSYNNLDSRYPFVMVIPFAIQEDLIERYTLDKKPEELSKSQQIGFLMELFGENVFNELKTLDINVSDVDQSPWLKDLLYRKQRLDQPLCFSISSYVQMITILNRSESTVECYGEFYLKRDLEDFEE